MFNFPKCIVVKDTWLQSPLKRPPFASDAHPITLATSCHSAGGLFHRCFWSHWSGYLDIKNGFKTFTFCSHWDFREEPEVTWYQVHRKCWTRTQRHVSMSPSSVRWHSGCSHHIFDHTHKATIDGPRDECVWRGERGVFQKGFLQCVP